MKKGYKLLEMYLLAMFYIKSPFDYSDTTARIFYRAKQV